MLFRSSIKVVRDGQDGNVGLSGHESEKYDLEAEYTLYNDNHIADLWEEVDGLMDKLKVKQSETALLKGMTKSADVQDWGQLVRVENNTADSGNYSVTTTDEGEDEAKF